MPSRDADGMSEHELAAIIYRKAAETDRVGETSIAILAEPQVRVNTNTIITYWVPGMDHSNLNARAGFASFTRAGRPRYNVVVALEEGFNILRNSGGLPHYKFDEGPYKTPLRRLADGKNINGTVSAPEKIKPRTSHQEKTQLVGRPKEEPIERRTTITRSTLTGKQYDLSKPEDHAALTMEIQERELVKIQVLKDWGIQERVSDKRLIDKIKQEVARRMGLS